MKNKLINVLCLSLVFMLSACFLKSKPTSYYVLENKQITSKEHIIDTKQKPTYISILPIDLPHYLSRIEIISKKGQVELLIHEFHNWGEDLSYGIARVLSSGINKKLSPLNAIASHMQVGLSPTYSLKVEILHFEGEFNKSTNLEARWILRENNQVIAEKVFNAGLALNKFEENKINTNKNKQIFTDYAEKNSKLIDKLAEEIADFIKTKI